MTSCLEALRRRDLDVRDPEAATITVAQNVSQGGKGVGAVVGPPKTEAGSRIVAIPQDADDTSDDGWPAGHR